MLPKKAAFNTAAGDSKRLSKTRSNWNAPRFVTLSTATWIVTWLPVKAACETGRTQSAGPAAAAQSCGTGVGGGPVAVAVAVGVGLGVGDAGPGVGVTVGVGQAPPPVTVALPSWVCVGRPTPSASPRLARVKASGLEPAHDVLNTSVASMPLPLGPAGVDPKVTQP